MRMRSTFLFGLALAACGEHRADANDGPATPETLAARIAAARDGETIRLAPGGYGPISIKDKHHERAVVVEADGAILGSLDLRNVQGLTIRGGVIGGLGLGTADNRTRAVRVTGSSNITLENLKITDATIGILLWTSSDIVIRHVELKGLRMDGIVIAMSRRVTVTASSCRGFSPIRSVRDGAGNVIKDGDHSDCIQAFSRPGEAPTADIVITDNDIDVDGQGIFFGNHTRNGVDDGGFDRVRIENNRVRASKPRGISLENARNSVVRGNTVGTVPGTVNPRNGAPMRAGVYANGTGITFCGNVVADKPANPGTQPCR